MRIGLRLIPRAAAALTTARRRGMTRQEATGQPSWYGEARERVVVCIDLYNSMDGRRDREALPRSADFLCHNSLLFECFQDWYGRPEGEQAGIDLVNFSGDAGLITFHHGFGETALAFACDVLEQVRATGYQTVAGVDVGEVAAVELVDRRSDSVQTRYAVGYPVDRAVRLSWIAAPGEILATSSLTTAIGSLDGFELLPGPDPVGVSLDKWPSAQVSLFGEVLVHSVRRRTGSTASPSRPPANVARLVDYFHRLQLNALDFLRESPRRWGATLDAFGRQDRWHRVEVLDDFIEALDRSQAIDSPCLPELATVPQPNPSPLEMFATWRENMIASIRSIRENYHDVTVQDVEKLEFSKSMEKIVGELIVFSRASLKALEKRS